MSAESLAYYERAAERSLMRMGLTRQAVRDGLPEDVMLDPKLRYEAWLWDSIAEACRLFARAERDDNVVALRCLFQVCDYCGRLGHWPGPTAADAYLTLRNHAEDLLRPLDARSGS